MFGHRLGGGVLGRRGSRRAWTRWSVWTARHPIFVLGVFGIPLALLAAQWTRLARRMPNGDWLPREMESARGLAALRAMDRGGIVQTIRVIVELPSDTRVLAPHGWSIARDVERVLMADPRIGRVRSLATIVGPNAP